MLSDFKNYIVTINEFFLLVPNLNIFLLRIVFISLVSVLATISELFNISFIFLVISQTISPIENFFLNDYFIKYFSINFREISHLYIILILIFMIFLSIFLRILSLKINVNIARSLSLKVENNIYKKFLNTKYNSILSIESSEIIATLSIRIWGTVAGMVIPLINIISYSVSLLIIFLPLGYFYTLELFFSSILIITYFIVTIFFLNKKLKTYGFNISEAYEKNIALIHDSFHGFREIFFFQASRSYIKRFNKNIKNLRSSQAEVIFLSILPRLLLELLAMILLVVGIYSIVNFTMISEVELIAFLGILVFSLLKIMPFINMIYTSTSQIIATHENTKMVIKLSKSFKERVKNDEFENHEILDFEKIELSKVSFRYPNSNLNALSEINFILQKGDCVAISGESGSGKSTLISVISTLLEPTDGEIKINGKYLKNENINLFRNSISYLGQSTYLMEGLSVAENITLGSVEKIDFQKMKEISKMVNINSFIETLPKKYNEIVGSGRREFSGGQKQRIAISRSLYHSKKIYIFDEATSALDEDNKTKIIQIIKILKSSGFTILIVSHDKDLLDICNRTIKIKDGLLI